MLKVCVKTSWSGTSGRGRRPWRNRESERWGLRENSTGEWILVPRKTLNCSTMLWKVSQKYCCGYLAMTSGRVCIVKTCLQLYPSTFTCWLGKPMWFIQLTDPASIFVREHVFSNYSSKLELCFEVKIMHTCNLFSTQCGVKMSFM